MEETILMVLLVAIAVVMMAQVVMRYCFRQSMPWPEEFCRFCFVYSGFISMGYCVRSRYKSSIWRIRPRTEPIRTAA